MCAVLRFSVGMLALGCMAQSAAAATVYFGNNFDIRASYLVSIEPNLRAFTLIAVGKNGAQPRVFDGTNSGQGGMGITTEGNFLHQVWEGGFVPTPTNNLVVPGSIPQSIDTHFLVDTSTLFITQLPAEDRPLADPAQHPLAGYGSFLTGAFALVGQAYTNWNVAYIVVPVGTTVNFNFEIGAAGFASESVTRSLTMAFQTGDVNIDGKVDILDVNVASAHWGEAGPAGDVNGSGAVDIFDVNMISNYWSPAVAATIPEPAALPLAGLAALALLPRWRGRPRMRANSRWQRVPCATRARRC